MDRKAVWVKWLDPHSVDEWKPVKELDKSITYIESFGYEIHRDDKVTVISLNYDKAEESVSCTTIIPDECVVDYKYVDFIDD